MSDSIDEGTGRDAAAAGGLPPGPGAASGGQVSSGGGELVGMMLYLVLERAAVLSEGGYVLQAIIQVLDALGERNALRSCLGEGDPETQLLRLSSALRHEVEVSGNGEVGTDEVGGELPEVCSGFHYHRNAGPVFFRMRRDWTASGMHGSCLRMSRSSERSNK